MLARRRDARVPPSARPLGGLRRAPSARSGARRTARSPTRCPTATPTGAPGTSPRRASGPTTRRRRRSSRRRERAATRSAYAVAARGVRARRAPARRRTTARGRLLFAAADAAWLGGQAERALALLDEAERTRDGTSRSLHRVDQPPRRDRDAPRAAARGLPLLVAAAERAADDGPGARGRDAGRGVARRASTRATRRVDAAAARSAPRARGRRPKRPRRVLRARSREGMALVLGGRGRGAAPTACAARRRSLEALGELRDDPRLLVWAASGRCGCARPTPAASSIDRASSARARRRASGCCRTLLPLVARDQAARPLGRGRGELRRGGPARARDGPARRARRALAGLAGSRRVTGARPRAARTRRGARVCARARHRLYEIWALRRSASSSSCSGDVAEAVGRFEAAAALDAHCGIADVDLSPAPELVER